MIKYTKSFESEEAVPVKKVSVKPKIKDFQDYLTDIAMSRHVRAENIVLLLERKAAAGDDLFSGLSISYILKRLHPRFGIRQKARLKEAARIGAINCFNRYNPNYPNESLKGDHKVAIWVALASSIESIFYTKP